MSVDLYDILGVNRNASQAEIKSAYRRLALRYHPDQNPGDRQAEERFKEVSKAYDVLGDPDKRRAYDRLGGNRGVGGGGGAGFESLGELFDVLNSVLSAGLGGLKPSGSRSKGEDLRVSLTISLEEAYTGVRRDVTVPRRRACSRCGGSGAEPGTSLRPCPQCDGQGKVKLQQGLFSLTRDCKNCRGRGRVPETNCRRCDGDGTIEATELLPVDVPAGVRHGQTLRWSGKGAPGRHGGEAGDLLVELHVKTHRQFKRDGQDIHLVMPISFTQASLGAKVDIPTLDGKVRMKVPPGTSSGRVFRLRGKGLPPIKGHPRGDQYVRLKVGSKGNDVDHGGRNHRSDANAGRERDVPGRIWKKVRDFFE
jgi:molecular chaperone DnaJ